MKMINIFTGMIDLFDSWFTRFTSEDHSYGSPQQIEPEPTEEKDSAAEPTTSITEKIAEEEPASPKTEQPKAPKPTRGMFQTSEITSITKSISFARKKRSQS